MDENELDTIYKRTLSEELVSLTKKNIQLFMATYPYAFGLEALYPPQPLIQQSIINEEMSNLYQQILNEYNSNQVLFDHNWVKYIR